MKVRWLTGVSGAEFSILPKEVSDSTDPACPLDEETLKRYVKSGACEIIAEAPVRETAMAAPSETAMQPSAKARAGLKAEKKKGGK